MLYDLECEYCGLISEHSMMSDEIDKRVECPHCGEHLCRREHRIYDVPMIQGDTVAGMWVGYHYDEGMGEYVSGRSHRKELMEKKGLTEYAPDPSLKKHRDEARYIRSRAEPGDPEAKAAIRKEYKTASDKRRNRLIGESLDKSFKKMDAS